MGRTRSVSDRREDKAEGVRTGCLVCCWGMVPGRELGLWGSGASHSWGQQRPPIGWGRGHGWLHREGFAVSRAWLFFWMRWEDLEGFVRRSDTIWLLRPQPWWLCREACAGASRGCFSWVVLETDLRQGCGSSCYLEESGKEGGKLVEGAGRSAAVISLGIPTRIVCHR